MIPMFCFGQTLDLKIPIDEPIVKPVITFDKTVHDFGIINEGETVETTFTFNTRVGCQLFYVDRVHQALY